MNRLYFAFFLFLVPGLYAVAQDCQLHPPKGLFISDITSCSATLHWTSSADVSKYQVAYKLSSSTQWSPFKKVKTDTFYTFTGLQAGKKYDFGVQSKCPDGSVSPLKQKSAKTVICTLPDMGSIVPQDSSTVKIQVESDCPYSFLYVKYSTLTGAPVLKSFAPAASYFIHGLDPDETYIFQVSTCKKQLNAWTPPDTVHLIHTPNILFILIDDARADYFSCDGAFPFMQTPNVDRIANEGVNFKRAYVATSLCAPSRATIATGLFTLKTGVTENGIKMDSSFVTIPEVLNDHNYYTALVGKNHGTFLNGSNSEFKYYCESLD